MAACALLSSACATRVSNSASGWPLRTCWPRLTRTRVITPDRSARAGIHSTGSTLPLVESMLTMVSRATRVNSTSGGLDLRETIQATSTAAATRMRARRARPRAIVEKELPFRALDLERGLPGGVPWDLASALAIVDEVKRIPPAGCSKSGLRLPRGNVRGGFSESREDRMRADLPEPVRCVARVRFLAVQDPVPETAFRCGDLLRGFVALFETGEVHPQPGPASIGSVRARKQIGCFLLCQKCDRSLRRTAAGYQRNQTVSVLIESQNLGHAAPVYLGIEWQFLLSQKVPRDQNLFQGQSLFQNLFQNHQRLPGGDRIAVPDADFQHLRRPGRFHFILHLHRLDDDQARAGFHGIALFHQHADHFTGHGRGDVLAAAFTRRFRAFGGVARIANLDAKAAALELSCLSQANFEAAAVYEYGVHARLDLAGIRQLRFLDLDRPSIDDDLPLHRSKWHRPPASQLLTGGWLS